MHEMCKCKIHSWIHPFEQCCLQIPLIHMLCMGSWLLVLGTFWCGTVPSQKAAKPILFTPVCKTGALTGAGLSPLVSVPFPMPIKSHWFYNLLLYLSQVLMLPYENKNLWPTENDRQRVCRHWWLPKRQAVRRQALGKPIETRWLVKTYAI